MPEIKSVVTIHDNRRQAEEAVTELQGAGFDMTKVSIIGDVKTGRVFVVCDGPWIRPIRGLMSRQARALRARSSQRRAPFLNGLVLALP